MLYNIIDILCESVTSLEKTDITAVYLDNSSTTKPSKKAVEYTAKAMLENWGNPSSLHILGVEAQIAVDNCRKKIASMIKAEAGEIVFTGSGTEANNTALLGGARLNKRRGNRVITTSIEHPSVLETVKRLQDDGFEVIRLKPQSNGVISQEDLLKYIDEKTVLVSVMLVNNELGSIEPIKRISEIIKEKNSPAILHCDAVQGFGKMPISVKKFGVDLMSCSAHKVHGPKGLGFLYIRKGLKLPALITGGGQEGGIRSGTEPTPLICGLAGAVEDLGDINKNLDYIYELRDYAKSRLLETGLAVINSDENTLPYILNISVLGYRSETLLHFLEGQGVYVSSGSACAKGEGSYVLKECGFDRKRIDSALRLSFSKENSKSDIDFFVTALQNAAKKLRKAYK